MARITASYGTGHPRFLKETNCSEIDINELEKIVYETVLYRTDIQ